MRGLRGGRLAKTHTGEKTPAGKRCLAAGKKVGKYPAKKESQPLRSILQIEIKIAQFSGDADEE